MLLIGLGAKARQGKNYVANYMKEVHPEIVLYSFADELKLHCKEHHDELVPLWQLANQTKALPTAKEDRIYGYTAILQWYGTDVVRKNNPNQWVDVVANKIREERPEIAIITDVRFPNEAAYIKNHDGFMVEVIRLNEDGTRYHDPNRDKNHISETALDEYLGYDYHILCKSGNLDSLRIKSQFVLKTIVEDRMLNQLGPIDDATGFGG